MAGFTVKDLKGACELMIENGKGDRDVFISSDDEGNHFHRMLYLFTDDAPTIKSYDLDPDKDILLG